MLSSKNLMKNKKKKGFSLLEIVVSLGLIALFIIPMGNMVLGTVKINKAAEDKQQASAVLQETVEQIKSLEEFPKEIGKPKSLSNGAILKLQGVDADGKTKYLVEKPNNEYGIDISGHILAEEVFSETVNIPGDDEEENNSNNNIKEEFKNIQVDGVVYYDGNKSYDIINTTIGSAINKIGNYITTSNSENSLKIKVGKKFLFWDYYFNIDNTGDKKSDYNTFLVIVDNYNGDFTVDFESFLDWAEYNRFTVYTYNAGNNDSDILVKKANKIEVEKEKVPSVPDGDGEDDIISEKLGINKYSIQLESKKDTKLLDTLSLDFVKKSRTND
ncbi:type IV pilus modification PilV family protein [Clostridium culturomicium]|uniref:type IV pilus modification PilV family protein n=1 Tax=Clostridium culturomicium TaxID=1499683 RepID=UPI003857C27C